MSNSQGSVTSNAARLTIGSTGDSIVPNTMIAIPGGTFQMGSANGNTDETPVHAVSITAFHMSNTAITQGEYLRLMGNNPWYFPGDLLRPVEQVTWFDAIRYCMKRTSSESKQ